MALVQKLKAAVTLKPRTTPPLYIQQQAIRAGIAAGIALQAGATIAEVKELTYITIAETGARPSIRVASKNRAFKGFRYADIGMWQTSLLHAPKTELTDTAVRMMNPVTGIIWALSLLRAGQVFNAVAAVKNPVTPDDLIKSDIAQAVVRQLDLIWDRAMMPIDVTQLSEPA